jgi:ABC-type transporter Mla MlaB component
VTLNLANLTYLDAGALQIMLALDREQKNSEKHLSLVNASQDLLRWLDYSGATGVFSIVRREADE